MKFQAQKHGTHTPVCKHGKYPSWEFEWDAPVIAFVESLKYHDQENVLNLLRGPGRLG